MDCFTSGKGKEAGTFVKFYEESELPCRVIQIKKPQDVREFMDVLYQAHAPLTGDVRFIFESITGMQELWGGEEEFLDLYAHSCPRLYDLNTIAYWTLAKHAHSPRFRATIN